MFLKQPLKRKFHSGYSKAPNLGVLCIYIYIQYTLYAPKLLKAMATARLMKNRWDMPWQILRFNKFFMSLGWHRHGSATNVPQGVHLPYEWIVVLNSCHLFRFAGLHTYHWWVLVTSCHSAAWGSSNQHVPERDAKQSSRSTEANDVGPSFGAFGAWRLDVWERLQVSWGVVI